MNRHRKISLVFWALFLILTAFVLFHAYKSNSSQASQTNNGGGSSTSSSSNQVRFVPLTDEQRQKVESTILSEDFVNSIPEKDPISLRFFYFENGSRVWQDTFYMADGKILNSASPGIKLTLHSKYIDELGKEDLCNVIQTANANRDLGFDSPYSNSKLLWKYKSLLKYRDCFGF